MLKNKHVVIAMLVAPILGVLAWFSVDFFVAEQPHAAKLGADYKLVAKSNCRYASGRCDLSNNDFELTLQAGQTAGATIRLSLSSKFPLQLVNIALAETAGAATKPTSMARDDSTGMRWSGTISKPESEGASIQLAVEASGSRYYAEISTLFLTGETAKH
jgi:hypothetical protein